MDVVILCSHRSIQEFWHPGIKYLIQAGLGKREGPAPTLRVLSLVDYRRTWAKGEERRSKGTGKNSVKNLIQEHFHRSPEKQEQSGIPAPVTAGV